MNAKVDFYFNKNGRWREEIKKLRTIVTDCGLEEVLKWGCPCYVYEGSNIVLIHVFKEYCALLFFKGALLQDPKGILIQQTENVQAARQVRFTSVHEVDQKAATVNAYIKEAIKIEQLGLKVEYNKTVEFKIPEEFQRVLEKDRNLKTAFEALTPGRQRAYVLFFAAPKQSKTRLSRIEKSIPQILDGKGLND